MHSFHEGVATSVAPRDIEDDILLLLEGDEYAHVDPLSEPRYLFDYADYSLRDPDLVLANHWMDCD